MSVLERNPQVPAPTPHMDIGPGIDGREIPKGSLVCSYEAEKGLLWMKAGRSVFLSSGEGNVEELHELQ